MAEQPSARVVLVTGTSSGIGRLVADRLAAAGWVVYGGSRRALGPDAGSTVGWTPIGLDVTSGASIQAAVDTIAAHAGRLDALVHCAGIVVAGAIEDVSIAEAEHQLATNYFGTVRMLKAVLPVMRRQGRGKIVVIGSIGGLIGLPFIGHYSASKFALDGMMQALRIEIAPFGVDATIVHPGDVQSDITSVQVEGKGAGPGSAYYERFKRTNEIYDRLVREGPTPDAVARAVVRALGRRRMPARLVVGTFMEKGGVFLKATLPPRLFELVIRSNYKL